MVTQYLTISHGTRLAYNTLPGISPGVFFMTGLKSTMEGSKALALEAMCQSEGRAFTRFDYSGHGMSSGKFEEGTIGQWQADTLAVFDTLTTGPQIIVGSSMGGWQALLLARARPERVVGLVGIASAPDFTEKLIWEQGTEEQRKALVEKGYISVPNCYDEEPYIITYKLIEDGRRHLLLHASIAVSCPVRLIHGTADRDVPWQLSAQLLDRIQSENAQLTLIKNGDHRLSSPEQLQLICNQVQSLL